MGKLLCEVCGSNNIVKEEGVFVCHDCGCKYTLDEVRKLMNAGDGSMEKPPVELHHDNMPVKENNPTVDALIKTASDIIVLYLNGIDDNGKALVFDQNEYDKAKKLLEQAELLAPDNWNIWFYKGLLSYVHYDEKMPSAFNEFDRAMKCADEETQINRILPMVENLANRAIKSLKEEGINIDPRVWLSRYVMFFNKYEVAKPNLQRILEEGDRLIAIYDEKQETKAGNRKAKDELFSEAGWYIVDSGRVSVGMLQRKLHIGFNRAASIIDQLAAEGVVGPEEGTKLRSVLMTAEQYGQYLDENY